MAQCHTKMPRMQRRGELFQHCLGDRKNYWSQWRPRKMAGMMFWDVCLCHDRPVIIWLVVEPYLSERYIKMWSQLSWWNVLEKGKKGSKAPTSRCKIRQNVGLNIVHFTRWGIKGCAVWDMTICYMFAFFHVMQLMQKYAEISCWRVLLPNLKSSLKQFQTCHSPIIRMEHNNPITQDGLCTHLTETVAGYA